MLVRWVHAHTCSAAQSPSSSGSCVSWLLSSQSLRSSRIFPISGGSTLSLLLYSHLCGVSWQQQQQQQQYGGSNGGSNSISDNYDTAYPTVSIPMPQPAQCQLCAAGLPSYPQPAYSHLLHSCQRPNASRHLCQLVFIQTQPAQVLESTQGGREGVQAVLVQ